MVHQNWYLYAVYTSLCICTTLYLFCLQKDIQSYDISIAETSLVSVPIFLPWAIKCTITDICLRISSKRKPFMILGNVLGAVTCWVLMIDSISYIAYVSLLTLMNLFLAIADCNYDTLMLLYTQLEHQFIRGKLQTYIKSYRELGYAIGVICGPLLWGLIGSKGVFALLGAVYLLTAIVCIFVNDDYPSIVIQDPDHRTIKSVEIDANGNPIEMQTVDTTPTRYSCGYTLGGIHQAWLNPTLRPLLIFTLLVSLFPSPSTPMFFFMNDQLHYTPNEMAFKAFIGEAASFISVWLTYKCARFISIRVIIGICIVLKIMVGLIPLVLVQTVPNEHGGRCGDLQRNITHWKNETCYRFEQENIDPLAITCLGDALEDAVDAFGTFPLERATTLICSSMGQSTVYSFILSLMNITGALRGFINSFFISLLDIDHGHYEHLPAFVLLCALLDLLSLCVVPMLPSTSVQDISSELERQRQVRNILRGEFSIVHDPEITLKGIASTATTVDTSVANRSEREEPIDEEIL